MWSSSVIFNSPMAPPVELGSDLAVSRPAMRQHGIVSFQVPRSQLHGQVAMRFVGLGLAMGKRQAGLENRCIWVVKNKSDNIHIRHCRCRIIHVDF